MDWSNQDEVREEARRIAIERAEEAYEQDHGPAPVNEDEAWIHTGVELDWDEDGAAWVITCRGERVSLDVEAVTEGRYATGYSPGPTFTAAYGHCPSCGMYVEVQVADGDGLEVTSEEDED